MKKYLIVFLLSILFILSSCNSDDTNAVLNETDNGTTATTELKTETTKEPETDEVKTIEVSTSKELLDNIGNNTKIVLTSKKYNLSDIYSVSNEFVKKSSYTDGFTIKNVNNCTIEGKAEIVIDDIYADVLSFENCSNITLDGLTVGHTEKNEQYSCDGAVVSISNCKTVNILDCNLFGCGSIGIFAYETKDLYAKNTNVYDCTFTGISLSSSTNGTIEDCKIYDIISEYRGAFSLESSDISVSNCKIYDNFAESGEVFGEGTLISIDDYYGKTSTATFTNCTFSENSFSKLVPDNFKNSTFTKCTFKDNVGDLSQNNIVFNECDIANTPGYKPNILPLKYGMTLDEMNKVLKSSGIKYTIVPIDECTYEYGSEPFVADFPRKVKDGETATIKMNYPAITINQINIGTNSVGGVELEISITNRDVEQKSIKYIFFDNFEFYNRVGDPAYCEISNDYKKTLKHTGPLDYNRSDTLYWDAVIYNNATAAVVPKTIRIEYMDGTEQIIQYNGYWYNGSYRGDGYPG